AVPERRSATGDGADWLHACRWGTWLGRHATSVENRPWRPVDGLETPERAIGSGLVPPLRIGNARSMQWIRRPECEPTLSPRTSRNTSTSCSQSWRDGYRSTDQLCRRGIAALLGPPRRSDAMA